MFRLNFIFTFLFLVSTQSTLVAGKELVHISSTSILGQLDLFIHSNEIVETENVLIKLKQQPDLISNNALLHRLKIASNKAEHRNSPILGRFYEVLHIHYQKSGDVIKSLEYALKLYHTESKYPTSNSFLCSSIEVGDFFYSQNDFNQAELFYRTAKKVALKVNNKDALSRIYWKIGSIFYQQKKYQLALSHYEKSCAFRQQGNEKWLALNYIKIAEVYLKLQQKHKAMYYIHLAEEYYYFKGFKTALLSEIPFFIENAYVEYYSLTENSKEVHAHTLNAREFALKTNNKQEYYLTFLKEASFFINENEHQKAIHTLTQIIPKLERANRVKELQISYQFLLSCYLNTKQMPLAKKNYEKYIHVSKIVDSTKHSMEQRTLQTLTELFESEKKLSQLQKKLQISKIKNGLDLSHKQLFLWLLVLVISVILVLVILLLNLMRNKKRLQQLHFQSLLQNNEIKLKSNELMRSDQIKDKLFSIIAHDLRNPLNRLMVELAIVKKSIGSEMTAPMENTLRETIGLFERLLQWSKMNNKQDNFYAPLKINLNETINKVISFYLPEMQSKKISITNNSETVFVFVDPNILQTLLRNFFSNSISALAENGKIEVEIFQPDEEHVELQISDSGPGFPTEVLNEFRVEKSEMNESGSGLGLTLCKVLAKMSELPLKISNESKYQGALVSIVLPIFKEKKKTQELNLISRSFEPDDFWKAKLKPIRGLKFYQTSQIRAFIKSLGTIDNPQVRFWVRQVEKSVHQGDQEAYAALLNLLEN